MESEHICLSTSTGNIVASYCRLTVKYIRGVYSLFHRIASRLDSNGIAEVYNNTLTKETITVSLSFLNT